MNNSINNQSRKKGSLRFFIFWLFFCLLASFAAIFWNGSARAATTSGTLTFDEVWSGTVNVTGDVTVPSDIKLQIEPGTVVRFAALSDETNGGDDASLCELIVYGGLEINGGPNAPVIFTSDAVEPAKGDWGGIRARGSTFPFWTEPPIFFINHAVVEYASRGISCGNSFPRRPSPLAPVIKNSTIRHTTEEGIHIYSSNGIVLTIKGCTIHNSSGSGISFSSAYGSATPTIHMNNNIIYNNEGYGIYIYVHSHTSLCQAAIMNNEVYSNSKSGLYILGWDVITATINNNKIHDNIGDGLFLNCGYYHTISMNEIYGNQGRGILYRAKTAVDINYNNIFDNTDYAVCNDSSYAIDARYNWWGDEVTLEMNQGENPKDISKIYDIHDNASNGGVNYSQWQSEASAFSMEPASYITDPVSGIHTNAKQYSIRGVASSGAGIDKVEVSTDGGSTWHKAEGGSTWSYNWEIPFDGTYIIQSRIIDNNGIAETPGEGVVIVIDSTLITSSGKMVTDEVWSGIIEITGDVIVPEGVTLIIEPGTEIRFALLSDDTFSGYDTSRCELIINGSLDAAGTLEETIIFTSGGDNPVKGDWAGIRGEITGDLPLGSQAPIFYLEHFVVEYGIYGVYYGNRDIDTLSPPAPLIGNGTIHHTSGDGIYIHSYDGSKADVLIQGCTIYSNNGSGIYTSSTDYKSSPMIQITGNTIYSNNDCGIKLYYGYNVTSPSTIINNRVYENSKHGISITGSMYHILIMNDIYFNQENGIYCKTDQIMDVNYNNIYGNSDYAVYNDSAYYIDARYNWWGDSTFQEIAEGDNPKDLSVIFDIYDNSKKGVVDYSLWQPSSLIVPLEPTSYITDPASGSHIKATTYTIRGIAFADAGIAMVEVSTDGGATWHTAEGEASWSYTWEISGDGTYIIKSRVTDNDGAVETPKEGVTFIIDSTVLTSSGQLMIDEVWSGTLNITGDVIVPEGITLFIEPSTVVRFAALSDDTFSGDDTSRCELIINGALEANGTFDDPISFTSSAISQENGDWAGIRGEISGSFSSEAQPPAFQINHAIIEYASFGISYSSIVSDTISPLAPAIRNSTVRNTAGEGIYIYSSNACPVIATIEGCTIHNNTGAGIYSHSSGSYASMTVHLTGNTIYSNGSYGIRSYGNYYNSQSSSVIKDNDIYSNGDIGLYIQYGRTTIYNNRVHENLKDGINIYGGIVQGISFNDIYSNAKRGIYYHSYQVAYINYNNIYDNLDYSLYNDSSYAIDARYNWWGDAITQEMNEGENPKNVSAIYDIFDNNIKGLVDYSDWLTPYMPQTTDPISYITHPVSGDIVKAADLTIRGVAFAGAGINRVEVSTDGGSTWHLAQGTTSWYYLWEIQADGTYTIQSRVVDNNGIFEAPKEGRVLIADSTLLTTSGTLTNDETWSGTIYITGDITVPHGVTLNIEPGTVVSLSPLSDDTYGGDDTSRCELIIKGSLEVNGTSGDPAIFTSFSQNPAKGDWAGIRADISGPFSLDAPPPKFDLYHSIIEYASYGVRYEGQNTGNLLHLSPVIRDCTIRYTMGDGIEVSNSSNSQLLFTIKGCTIYNNSGSGIYANRALPAIHLSGNDIYSNSSYGIYLNSSSSKITNNMVHENSRTGIYINGGQDHSLLQNNIYSNGENGIYSRVNQAVNMNYNNIYGNTKYAVYNASSYFVDARYNWWGEETTQEITEGDNPRNISDIYDIFDQSTYGVVDYSLWQSSLLIFPLGPISYITDPVSGGNIKALSYTVKGVAFADEGIAKVEVSTDDGATWDIAEGMNLWTYTWEIPGDGEYSIQSRVTDNNGLVEMPKEATIFTVDSTILTTSGELITDEVWSGIIDITGDVIVPQGVALTVEAGTVVRAAALSDDTHGGEDTSRCELIIHGTLEVKGTEGSEVIFTSDAPSPAKSDWSGIRVIMDEPLIPGFQIPGFYIDHAIVEYASYGISYKGTDVDISSPLSMHIMDSIIRFSANDGIYIYSSHGSKVVATIKRCIIHNNNKSGVYGYSRDSAALMTINLEGNHIYNNGNHGIQLYNSSASYPSIISNNDIYHNENNGIIIEAGLFTINNNKVHENLKDGIYISWGVNNTIICLNEIYGNKKNGIYSLAKQVININYNSIYGNYNYLICNDSSYAMDARYNWWGDAATQEMNEGDNPKDITAIFDIYDNSSKGRVDYSNWQTSPLSLTYEPASFITDPLTGKNLKATHYTFRGVASAGAGIWKVEVSTDGGKTWDMAQGGISWSYTWEIPSDGTYTIQSRVIDNNGEVEIPKEGVILIVDSTTLTTSGTLVTDEVWSELLEITGDVIVPFGITLTIEPGTMVRFSPLSDDTHSGNDTSRSELIVEGGLEVNGTLGDPVIFTSSTENPADNDWGGLRANITGPLPIGSEPPVFYVNHTIIEYATCGINYWSKDTGTLSPPSPLISNSIIRNIGGDGISIISDRGSQAVIGVNRCTIHNNIGSGIYGETINYSTYPEINLTNNTIYSNGHSGIRLTRGHRAGTFSTLIANNDIYLNNYYGIYVLDGTATINSNSVHENLKEGIYLSGGFCRSLSLNTIYGNEGKGIYYNVNNVAPINYSNIFDNVGYAIYNDSSYALDARYNWWGEEVTQEITAGINPKDISVIHDIYDNSSKGFVDYLYWQSQALYATKEPTSFITQPISGSSTKVTNYIIRGVASAGAGIARVGVSTDDGLTWHMASGSTYWNYPWEIPSEGTYIIKCRVTDNNGITEIPKEGVILQVDNSILTTSGRLVGDETWSGIVDITGDVTIPSGVTLTIEAGTLVRFSPLIDDTHGGEDSSRCELVIKGALMADGSSDNPIIFTSGAQNPEKGDWKGIRAVISDGLPFGSQPPEFYINHAVIEYSSYGLDYNNTITGTLPPPSPILSNSTIRNTAGDGIFFYTSNSSHFRIENCSIYNNSGSGISSEGYNNKTDVSIINSSFYANGAWGIRLYLDSSGASYINNNSIYENMMDGICIGGGRSHSISLNDIYNNEGNGIFCDNTKSVDINHNNIYDNISYAVYNNSAYAIDGRFNWWGDEVTNEILEGENPREISAIYDIYDDSKKGVVDYSLWQTSILVPPLGPSSYITDPESGSHIKAASFTIRGVASSGTAGIEGVEVSTDGGATWNKASGGLSWSYVWDIPSDGTYTIKSRVTDRLGQVETPKEGVILVVDSTTLTTSGSLSSDEIWSGTLNITGDVKVPSGITLTIEPGTEVRFAALSDDTNGGDDTSRCELIIIGNIDVNGTPEVPVIFTSDAQNPEEGDWGGIRASIYGTFPFWSQPPIFYINNAIIEYATYGVRYQSERIDTFSPPSPVVLDSIIRNSSSDGIYIYSYNESDSVARIEGCSIYENTGNGIYAYSYGSYTSLTVNINNSDIYNNGENGIYLHTYHSSFIKSNINNNKIGDNSENGIEMFNEYRTRQSTVVISNNTIYENSKSGIRSYTQRVYDHSQVTAINNIIHDNVEDGIYLSASLGYCSSVINNNTIYNNNNGLKLIRHSHHSLNNNDIYNNVNGIYLSSTEKVDMNYNNIYDNSGFYVYNDSQYALDARYNWWGDSVTQVIAEGNNPKDLSAIYDIFEDTSKGVVDYSYWQLSALPVTMEPISYITEPAPGIHIKAGSYVIRGVASAGTGIAKVEVSTDNGSTWHKANGKTSWDYTFEIPSDGTYIIQSRATDINGLVETPRDGVVLIADSSIITTSGSLVSDEVWSGTIEITGDVTVPSGTTLTIEPGTVIGFAALFDDTHSGEDTSRCELIINGDLLADGTPGMPILFTSSGQNPKKGDWSGIKGDISGSGAPYLPAFHIMNAIVEYASCGISYKSTDTQTTSPPSPIIRNSTIRHSAGDGIYIYSSNSSKAKVLIENCTIHNNSGSGINAYSNHSAHATVDISNSMIYSNEVYGIYLSLYNPSNSSLRSTISNNRVYYNMNDGIYIGEGVYPTLFMNEIHSNGGRGVYSYAVQAADMNYNNIYDNTGYAIYNDSIHAINARFNWWGDEVTQEITEGENPKDISVIYDTYDDNTKGRVEYSLWLSSSLPLTMGPTSYITEPLPGTHIKAASYTIRGVASAGAGISKVEVSTDGGATWNMAKGGRLWSYNWEIPTDGDYIIQSRVTDNNGIVEEPKEGVVLVVDSTILTTSGSLISDEIWSGTLDITGDVTVPTGIKLTIMPGTIVRFTSLSDDTNGGRDSSRCELIINGSLEADGILGDPIIFTSSAEDPAKGDWGGIMAQFSTSLPFWSEPLLFSINHAIIEYASFGISYTYTDIGILSTPSLLIGNCIIRNTNGDGIYINTSTDSKANVTIEGCTIHNNSGYGIHSESTNYFSTIFNINKNTIYNNGNRGIYLYLHYYASCTSSIFNNAIYHNNGNGIGIEGGTRSNPYITEIKNNSIYGNYGIGVYCGDTYYGTNHADILNNDIFNNTEKGIQCNGSTYTSINNNKVHENHKDGIYISGGALPSISLNDIYSNGGNGVYYTNNNPMDMNYNNIFDNLGYAIYNDSSYSIDGRYNWWGDAATAEIATGDNPKDISVIYDIYDDSTNGVVDYSHWQSAMLSIGPDVTSYITDPVSGRIIKGADYTIRGVASAGSGVSMVEVSIDGGATWHKAEGTTSWSYNWEIGDDGAYIIQCRATDKNGITETPKEGIPITKDSSIFTTSGKMAHDEVWSGHIEITGDITVPSGVTLTIEPGSVIRFTPLHDDRYSGQDTSRCELIINGSLIINSASHNPIRFTSSSDSPAKGDWKGIRVSATSEAQVLLLRDSIIEYASYGVQYTSSSGTPAPIISNCTIHDTAGDGIYINAKGGSQPVVSIEDCTIYKNSGCGIESLTEYYNPLTSLILHIKGNTIHSNDSHGLFMNVDSMTNCSSFMENNTIFSNNGHGMYFRSSWNNASILTSITGNTIYENNGSGIHCLAESSDSLLSATINLNNIYDNLANGIYCKASQMVSMNYNNIHNNTNYSIYNDSSHSVDARYNWWGDDVTQEMDSGNNPKNISAIYDLYDDNAIGVVDYSYRQPLPLALTMEPISYIIYPVSGTQSNATTYIIRGVASAGGGIEKVEVSTDGGTTWHTAEGTTSWSYTWEIPGDGTYIIQSRVSEKNGLAEIPKEGVVFIADSTLLTTSGTLKGDEVWSGSIDITGDISVPSGITLTIEPGTVVRFAALSDDTGGGNDVYRCEFTINGSLIANGTPENPIIFTSSSNSPAKSDWGGIRGTMTNEEILSIQHAVIEYASFGLIYTIDACSPDLIIRDCTIQHTSGNGIYIPLLNGSQARVFIEDCTIHDNSGSGIYSYGKENDTDTTYTITGNTIYNNGSYGICLIPDRYSSCTATIDNNTLYYNNHNCISLWAASGTKGYIANISNNTVYMNNGEGIYCGGYGTNSAYIYNNQIYSNTSRGISCHSELTATIVKNSIYENMMYGILLNVSTDSVIYLNDIFGNEQGGISCDSSAVIDINYNNIYDNIGYEIYNYSSYAIDGRYNWWGDAVTEEITQGGNPKNISAFYDIYEDSGKGVIDYSHWLTSSLISPSDPTSYPTDPVSGSLIKGTSYTIRGAAFADAGIASVEVSTDGGATWNLAEGTVLWSYTWEIPGDGTYTIQYRATDNNGAVETPKEGVIVEIDTTVHTTSGTLLSDETWSGDIHITGDVTIPSGLTLTIEPGTIIRVTPLLDDTYGGNDTSRCELIVNGSLMASGTSENPITFTSDSGSPAKGDWGGILVEHSNEVEVFTLQLSVIEYASFGIRYIYNTSGTAPDLVISNDTVRHTAGDGILIQHKYSVSNNPMITIEGCKIHNNSGLGVSVAASYADVYIIKNGIYSNGDNGIYSYSQLSVLKGNDIYSNGKNGIYAGYKKVIIVKNRIYNNLKDGIYTYNLAELPAIALNDIYGNGGIGVYNNTSKVIDINYNNIYDNILYDIYNNVSNALYARHNWWGDSVTQEMTEKADPRDISSIYDIYDNDIKGVVDYSDWQPLPLSFPEGPLSYIFYPSSESHINARSLVLRGIAFSDAGIAQVEVSTDGGATWDVAEGTSSWSYTWEISGDSTYTIQCRATDNNGVVETPKVATIIIIDTTPPTTSGALAADEIWSGLIDITGDVTVDAGITLTIEPGTLIMFNPLMDDTYAGNDTSRCELLINGSIIANGTHDNPIIFTSGSEAPAKGDWKGIRINASDGETVQVRQSVVEFSSYGIHYSAPQGSPDMLISNSTIRNTAGDGIFVESSSNAVINIDACTIYNNSGSGIYCKASHYYNSPRIDITGSEIYSNGDYGIRFYYFSYYSRSSGSSTITDNAIYYNNNRGISIEDRCQTLITSNNIYANNGDGIYHIEDSATILNNDIYYNAGTGVKCSGALTATINNNRIHENLLEGIYLDTDVSPTITINDIHDNGGKGVYSKVNHAIDLNYNNIYHNTTYGIFNDSPELINAENCHWGDESGPYDPSDDTSAVGLYNPEGLGDRVTDNIDYDPWLAEPIVNNPPIAHIDGPYILGEESATGGNWTVTFDARNSTDDFGIFAYKWDFGDGSIGTGVMPTHSYANIGTYTVTLTVYDIGYETGTTTTTVTVKASDPPEAKLFGPFYSESDSYLVRFDARGTTDDHGIYKYEWDFGDGTILTTGTEAWFDSYFITGTELYGFDIVDAGLMIIATQDDTDINIINLATKTVMASRTLNKYQRWYNCAPGDGIYFKIQANKPVLAYQSDFSWQRHTTFVPSLESGPVGKDFIFYYPGGDFYIFALEDADVEIYNTSGTLIGEKILSEGLYWAPTLPSSYVYHIKSSGKLTMECIGDHSYTTVPSANGSGVGRRFLFATWSSNRSAFAVFAYQETRISVYDMDTDELLWTQDIAQGSYWFKSNVGMRRFRIESTGDIEVWAGATRGSGEDVNRLGDDISFASGKMGKEFFIHTLGDGAVIFTPYKDTIIDIEGVRYTLSKDDYLHLDGGKYLHITSTQPIIIQTLGKVDSFYDEGTYLGGLSGIRHLFKEPGVYTVTMTVWDNALQKDTTTTKVFIGSPEAEAGPDRTIHEGEEIHFDATQSYDHDGEIVLFEWDFGDGATGEGPTLTHTYGDNGLYKVTLVITDNDGMKDSDTLTVTVDNSPPVVAAGTDQVGIEGKEIGFSGSFTDPGWLDTHIISWEFDDGDSTSGTLTPTHVYTDNGVYTVRLTVTDDDGASASDTLTVTVKNAAPVVYAGEDQVLNEGEMFSLPPSTFSDSGSSDTHTATIDWGDGTPIDAGEVDQLNATVSGSHIYMDDGLYTVIVSVFDDDGGSGINEFKLDVKDLGPTASLSGDTILNEGETGSYDASGSVSYPDAITVYEWDWEYNGITFNPSGDTGATQTHAWIDDGLYTVAVRVTDDDGSTDIATLIVTVNIVNNAPILQDIGPQGMNEGDSLSIPLSGTDPDVGDILAFSATDLPAFCLLVDNGNGTGSIECAPSFTDSGTYPITVTVTDDGIPNLSDSETFTLSVSEVTQQVQTIFNLDARAKSEKIQLTWGSVTGAGCYNIYRSQTSGGPYTLVANCHITTYCTYLDIDVTNGITYYYVVTSITEGIESLFSNEAMAEPSIRLR